MSWPWSNRHDSHKRLEAAERALEAARATEPRTRRLAKATERAIVQNHFAFDLKKAMEGK